MELQKINTPAAYMMHDIGPQRFHPAPAWYARWGRTELGGRILERMARHGLDARDAHLCEAKDQVQLSTDAGAVWIDDRTLAAHDEELERLFASVAAGITQERMARLAGWRPGKELPHWAVTVSDVVVRLLRENSQSPAALWNTAVNIGDDGWIDRPSLCENVGGYPSYDARSALPLDCYVARYSTGMHFSWCDGDLNYQESCEGAMLTLSTELLKTDEASTVVGKPLSEVLALDSDFAQLLGSYTVIDAVEMPAHPDCIRPQPCRTELRLAVPMRTLEEVPDAVLRRVGIDVPAAVERDRPLWILTPAETLLRYRPRRG